MHCNSKLSIIDDKINFLERKVFKYSQVIDELTLNIGKLNFLPTKKLTKNKRQNVLQNCIKQSKGKSLEYSNL